MKIPTHCPVCDKKLSVDLFGVSPTSVNRYYFCQTYETSNTEFNLALSHYRICVQPKRKIDLPSDEDACSPIWEVIGTEFEINGDRLKCLEVHKDFEEGDVDILSFFIVPHNEMNWTSDSNLIYELGRSFMDKPITSLLKRASKMCNFA